MIWPCRISRRIDFSSGLCVKPYLNGTRRNFLFLSRPQSWMKLILFHEDTFHSILSVCSPPLSLTLSVAVPPPSPPPPPLPHVSSEHTEIEQAWLMQHLSPPNVSFAQPFYAWMLCGKLFCLHLPTLLLKYHSSGSIKKNFDSFTASRRALCAVDQTCICSLSIN